MNVLPEQDYAVLNHQDSLLLAEGGEVGERHVSDGGANTPSQNGSQEGDQRIA